MSNRRAIRMTSITNRKGIMSNVSEPRINVEMCNYAKHIMNSSVVTELVKNVSNTVADSNKYWSTVMKLATTLDSSEKQPHKNIHSIIECDIIPKLDKSNLKLLRDYLNECQSEDMFMDIESLKSVIDDNLVMDRIVTNHKALSKRFNIDKIARESVRRKTPREGVYEICDLIDTYDISTQAKFNIAMENITYAMASAGYNKSVVSEITDYFLLNNPVLPDNVYSTMQSLISESRVLTDDDKSEMKYFTEAKNNKYELQIYKLSEKCKDSKSSAHIKKCVAIKNEKEASVYIKKSIEMANGSEDSEYIISSIFMIPLIGKVSKPFVRYQYKFYRDKNKVSNKVKNIEFDKKIEELLDDDDESLMVESTLVEEADEPNDTINEIVDDYTPNTTLLESENFGESEDIKTILKDFKAEQKKTTGRFKYYLGKIYRKSPESIIDETPNILSVIRIAFIMAPTIIVPIVGPVISLVMVFVDHLLSMHINDKQCKKLIIRLENERDQVNKDIEKKPEKKAELEKYGKCIDACIKKVDAYREANISSEEIEGRKGSSSDDELDFDMGDDIDFDLESAMAVTSAMNSIIESTQNNLTGKIRSIILDPNTTPDEINTLIESCKLCPRSININRLYIAARTTKIDRPIQESAIIESNVSLSESTPIAVENTISDIITEAYYLEQITSVINEGFNMNKLKLLMQAARGKMKDLSTKEKALWKNVDIAASGFMKSAERAMTSDRREGIIKGSLIPSFSKCIKAAILTGGLTFINPVLGIITAMGMIGVSKALNHKERNLIYDEIEIELKVVEKELELANNDGDMKKYRCLLQYQKRLERERQRIKYGLKVRGRDLPNARYDTKRSDD